jgi:knotted carbamoyltransferase YgeW
MSTLTQSKADMLLESLNNLGTKMVNRDFLLTWERNDDEIRAVLDVAQLMSDLHKSGISIRSFDTGLAIALFRDNSTRTRFSFASAANALGLGLSELDEEKSQIAHGETVRETANMISFLAETIGIRDDMFLGEGNKYMREFGASLQEGYENGILHQRPTIVNLQCDIDHPTQSLADLMHLKNTFGSVENLRGKKIAMTWAYSPSYGKPLSVPQAIIGLMSRFGMNVSLAFPEGYGLIPEVIEQAKKQSAQSGGSFEVVNNMEDAFKDADIVYPKSWAPFHVMQRRTVLLNKNDKPGLKDLEKECLENNAKFENWECDEKKMQLTKEGRALYMHCLPADITGVSCKQGEVSKDVFEKCRLGTYAEAGYKPFVIAAIIFLSRIKDPVNKLRSIVENNKERRM